MVTDNVACLILICPLWFRTGLRYTTLYRVRSIDGKHTYIILGFFKKNEQVTELNYKLL